MRYLWICDGLFGASKEKDVAGGAAAHARHRPTRRIGRHQLMNIAWTVDRRKKIQRTFRSGITQCISFSLDTTFWTACRKIMNNGSSTARLGFGEGSINREWMNHRGKEKERDVKTHDEDIGIVQYEASTGMVEREKRGKWNRSKGKGVKYNGLCGIISLFAASSGSPTAHSLQCY